MFYVKTATPLKIVTQHPPPEIEILQAPPPFLKFGWRLNRWNKLIFFMLIKIQDSFFQEVLLLILSRCSQNWAWPFSSQAPAICYILRMNI